MTTASSSLDLLLLVPPGGYYADRWQKGALMPPLGIGYVAAAAERAGFSVAILDAHLLELSEPQLTASIKGFNPRVVGVTFTTENRFEGFRAIKTAKRAIPEAVVVAGGPHVSLAAPDTLSHIAELDIVVKGEGEITIVELLQAQRESGDWQEVRGIGYRKDGQIASSPPQHFIQDLDGLAFPARHLYDLERYNFVVDVPGRGKRRFVNMMTSRGCPFNCIFCASTIMWGTRCRLRSADSVLAEIEEAKRLYHAEAIWIFDDTFNTSPARVEQICQGILERGWDLPWFCEVRVDTLSRETLALMKAAGCYCIGFGVESGSQRILDDVIGKHLRLEKVHEVMSWCQEIGVIANPFFIFSHPKETMEDAQLTLDLIKQYQGKAQISMALLHVYPGTRLEELARQQGSLPADFSWTEEHRTDVYTLPAAQGNVPIFVDALTWEQIGELLFAWADIQGYSIWKRIPKTLKSIRSPRDVIRYLRMFKAFLKRKKVAAGARQASLKS